MLKNINYVKYIEDTGEIRQWGTCKEDNIILTPEHREGNLLVLEGIGTNATHYVQLPELVIVEKPTKPSQYHVFDYTLKQWLMDDLLAWGGIRVQRDRLLAACDWTVMPDVPLSPSLKEAWVTYRQALRDIPAQSSPLDLVWPTPPN